MSPQCVQTATRCHIPQLDRAIGMGRLKGRWEVVLPGDPPPSQRDLLTEATLPVEERGLQQRYSLVETFDRFLPPTGHVVLPGPDPAKLPKNTTGLHLILLRIEATDDREGNSFIGTTTVNSGGVAGFPLPVLRYYVGASSPAMSEIPTTISLLQPEFAARFSPTQPIRFRWQALPEAKFYRLEVQQGDESILSAIVDSKTISYPAPPWLRESAETLRWWVLAIAARGKTLAQSIWREFELQSQGGSR